MISKLILLITFIERTPSDATSPGQYRPGSNGIEEVFHIPQSSKARPSPSDGLMSYPGLLLGGILPLCSDALSVFYSNPHTWPTGLYLY